MKTLMLRNPRRVLNVLTFLLIVGFTTHAFSQGVFMFSADLNGDGIQEKVYNATPYVRVVNSNGTQRKYYVGGTWAGIAVADLDGVAGNEYVVRTLNEIRVITHKTGTLSAYYVAGTWTHLAVDNFNGAAGKEVVLQHPFEGKMTIISQSTHTIKAHFFATTGSWSAFNINDFNGSGGKDIAVNLGTQVAILHPNNLSTRYYYVGPSWSLVNVANLDGVAGLEIRFKYASGLAKTINDRLGVIQ